MDWPDIATRLFERYGRPALLVDADLRVLRINRAAATAFGWDSRQAPGSPLAALVDLPPGEGARYPLPDAGQTVRTKGHVLTATGHGAPHHVEVRAISGGTPVYLMELTPWPSSDRTLPPPPLVSTPPPDYRPEVLRYEIDISQERFGMVHQGDPLPLPAPSWVGRHCYEALAAGQSPCPGCPAMTLSAETRFATAVMHQDGSYQVARARRVAPTLARVTRRELTDDLVRALIAARLDALAEGAKMSTREKAVFELLVMGRSLDEMARVLGISPRTVRFHQTNLLDKLGADSRLDLLRLLL
jgi:DNA-binding CsgD family transcriptional regulator